MSSRPNTSRGMDPPADPPAGTDEEEASASQEETSQLRIPDRPTGGAVWGDTMINFKRSGMNDEELGERASAATEPPAQPTTTSQEDAKEEEEGTSLLRIPNNPTGGAVWDDAMINFKRSGMHEETGERVPNNNEPDATAPTEDPHPSGTSTGRGSNDDTTPPDDATPDSPVGAKRVAGLGRRKKDTDAPPVVDSNATSNSHKAGDAEAGAFRQSNPAPFRSTTTSAASSAPEPVEVEEETPIQSAADFMAVATLVRDPTILPIAPAVAVPEADAANKGNDAEEPGGFSDLWRNQYMVRLVVGLCCFFAIVIVVLVLVLGGGSGDSSGGDANASVESASSLAPVVAESPESTTSPVLSPIPTTLSTVPTPAPSSSPSTATTEAPSMRISSQTNNPTINPTRIPTPNPTRIPTPNPTSIPTPNPTRIPTSIPTTAPTTRNPTKIPTRSPSKMPTPPAVQEFTCSVPRSDIAANIPVSDECTQYIEAIRVPCECYYFCTGGSLVRCLYDGSTETFGCAAGSVLECVSAPTTSPPSIAPVVTTVESTDSPTETPTVPSFPPSSEGGCYNNLDAIFYLISDDDILFQQKRYVVCPGTIVDVGFLVPGVGIDQGQTPLIPRSNTEFLCGEDGKSENNCIIRGGDFGLIGVPVFFRQDLAVNNVNVSGFTFMGQIQYAVFMATAGDITFNDCIFRDTGNFGTIVMNYDASLDLGRRLDEVFSNPWDAVIDFIDEYKTNNNPPRRLEDGSQHDLQRGLQEMVSRSLFKDCIFRNLQQVERKLGVEFGILTIKGPDHDVTMANCTFSNNTFGDATLTPIGYAILVQGAKIQLDGLCLIDNDFRGNGAVLLEETDDPFVSDGSYLTRNFATEEDDDLDCGFAAWFATEEDQLNSVFTCVPVQVAECRGEAIMVVPTTPPVMVPIGSTPTPLPTSRPTVDCYTSLDAIFFAISDDEKLFEQKRFVMCPGTVVDVGFLVPGVGIDNGQSPLVPRSNTEFLCGEDGRPENTCIIQGGDFGLIAVPVFFRQDLTVDNVQVRGFTFVGQVQYAVFMATSGQIDFYDCVFRDSGNFGTFVMNYDATLDLSRRLEKTVPNPWDAVLDYINLYKSGTLPRRLEGQQRGLQSSVFESLIKDCVFSRLQQVERKLGVEFGILTIKGPDHIVTIQDCTFSNNLFGNQDLTPIGYAILVQAAKIQLDGLCLIDNDFRGNGAVLLEQTGDPFVTDGSYLVHNFATEEDDYLDCAFAAWFATEEDRRNSVFTCVPVQVSECGGDPITSTPSPSAAPTAASFSDLLAFLGANAITSTEVLQDKSSAQYKAALWLADADSSLMSDSRVLQMFALATFYFATGGDNWRLCGKNSPSCGDTPWLSDTNECEWFSISCDVDGIVSQMSFPATGNDLIGVLPPELSLLPGLRRFLAPENSLRGDLDVAFGGLTSLETFAMPDNRLQGTIPTGILRSNSQLGLLALGGNQFSGTIPSAIAGASILSDLQLDYNSLTGTIPADIGSLTRLTNFEIQGNNFAGSVPNELYSLSRLNTVSIRENTGINGTISPLISQLTDLHVLQLGFTQLRGTIPNEMFALTDLSEMNLEGASFSGTIPEAFRNLNASLMDLFLNDNRFTGPVPEAFDYLTALETLQIQGNQLTGSISAEVCSERGLRFQQLATLIVDCVVECSCCDNCEE
ncbi:leucine rich repeat [Seminavis robusta]|uniref:Leucine rich repeat n=1 Tax=Seminavis robusta TaxID=568900 RepID=A0A9N8DIG9_9STRA|nr:leucine rich repeat [Seminavis robusta]|eukprot:Sro144_g067050.1 leucine rich repeat (1669) ;mRNA; r:67123-72837